eukprot:PhF_6_TR26095/c1_g1_i1/m.36865
MAQVTYRAGAVEQQPQQQNVTYIIHVNQGGSPAAPPATPPPIVLQQQSDGSYVVSEGSSNPVTTTQYIHQHTNPQPTSTHQIIYQSQPQVQTQAHPYRGAHIQQPQVQTPQQHYHGAHLVTQPQIQTQYHQQQPAQIHTTTHYGAPQPQPHATSYQVITHHHGQGGTYQQVQQHFPQQYQQQHINPPGQQQYPQQFQSPPPVMYGRGGKPMSAAAMARAQKYQHHYYDPIELMQRERQFRGGGGGRGGGGRGGGNLYEPVTAPTTGTTSPNTATNLPWRPTYKSKLCKGYLSGGCRYGDTCMFAHGEHDIVHAVEISPLPLESQQQLSKEQRMAEDSLHRQLAQEQQHGLSQPLKSPPTNPSTPTTTNKRIVETGETKLVPHDGDGALTKM